MGVVGGISGIMVVRAAGLADGRATRGWHSDSPQEPVSSFSLSSSQRRQVPGGQQSTPMPKLARRSDLNVHGLAGANRERWSADRPFL